MTAAGAIVRILHLEDNTNDAELFGLCLRKEWPQCEIDVVAAPDTFMARITRQHYDLILSDFSIAGFDGLAALQVARERTPDTPVIFLSGTIGEDRAIEAMRNGAADYVLKDRPKRLIPAIRHALEHAAQARDKRATEEQLLHVQRLENIGMLAAGIAHDFNNVLAPVLMGIPMLRDYIANPAMCAILSNMETSVRRGAGLVQQILGFAQGNGGRSQIVHPKHIVRELMGVIRQTFPKNIEIEERLERDLWPVEANATQLHQLFLNLCVNARDAMPGGGVLRFTAVNRQIDEDRMAELPALSPGPHVCFEVADNGAGIAPNIMAHIWDPFFTTKERGRGTGLGLPTVRRIIEAHRGAITVHSIPGSGTTFTVYLPAAANSGPTAGCAIETSAPRGNGELILVVDDDANVRSVTAALLTRHGYRALVASNGTEAVELLTPLLGEVRLVITDLGMPRLDGFALATVVRSLTSSIHILAMSGMADAEMEMRKQKLPDPVLRKPFTADTLLKAVHRLITNNPDTL